MKGLTKTATSAPEDARSDALLSNQDSSEVARERGLGVQERHIVSGYEKLLLLVFLLTLPLVNPWVRGDGVGYYAYVRSLLIDHNLRFENEWRAGNSTFVMNRVDSNGAFRPEQYTSTGYLDNHFSVGPAILWAPFLVLVHLTILGLNTLGAHIAADGFSRPYIVTMALATAAYGFAGLWLSLRMARQYFEERWAFLATLGIWFASSLPVYMYFNPSWSHAHSAFAVTLFFWYWQRTRDRRSSGQWLVLGAISGLMINVYYPNAVILLVLAMEALRDYRRAWKQPRSDQGALRRLPLAHALHAATVIVALLPTFITRKIIYGSPFEFGYGERWHWTSPALKQVLFSSNHGLFSWTPILIFAVLGLFLLRRCDRAFGAYLLAAFIAFYYLIASYSLWYGLSSFGNRFFVSLTPIFIIGLAAALQHFGAWFASYRSAYATATLLTAIFVLWNVGFLFQWGTHLVPARGPISWRAMAHNQVGVVPVKMAHTVKNYLVARAALMGEIERRDVEQLQRQTPEEH